MNKFRQRKIRGSGTEWPGKRVKVYVGNGDDVIPYKTVREFGEATEHALRTLKF